MAEFFVGIAAGIVVSLFNKYVVNGQLWRQCDYRTPVEEDGLSSESSAIISDIHVH
jgi:hypothetical protein